MELDMFGLKPTADYVGSAVWLKILSLSIKDPDIRDSDSS